MMQTNAIPARVRKATRGSLSAGHLRQVEKWAEIGREALLLCGPTGSGKTWTASVAARLWHRDRPSTEYLWVDVPFFAGLLRADHEQGWDSLTQCLHVGLLVLDDFGSEKLSEYLADRMYSVVNWRYSREKPLIVTTNLVPQELGVLWPRMASRLCSGTVIMMDGPDRRLADGL